MAWVDSEGFEPSLSRVRAGCASFALRAHGVIGGNRTRTPGVTDPCASLTRRPPCVAAAVRPEGIEPSSTAYRAAALPLCYGRRKLSRGGRDRTCDLTVPNRARCRCATPRGTVVAESKGVEPSDPLDHPLSRRAPGTDAGRTLRVSSAEGEGVEPSRLIAHPFSRRLPSPIGLPFQKLCRWVGWESNPRPTV